MWFEDVFIVCMLYRIYIISTYVYYIKLFHILLQKNDKFINLFKYLKL